jgi:hypothetical protein
VSTPEQNLQTLCLDLSAVLNQLTEARDDRDSYRLIIDAHVATIAAKDVEIADAKLDRDNLDKLVTLTIDQLKAANDEVDAARAEIARLTALLNPRPTFVLGDATRKQFLGAPFIEQFPFQYQSALYRSGTTIAQMMAQNIDEAFVVNNAIPDWRAVYPTSPRWLFDIEWQNRSDSPGGREVVAAEVSRIRPAVTGARKALGPNVKLGGYSWPRRFAVDADPAYVKSQIDVSRPILDLLDEALVTLYPIYTDLAKSRRYIQQNIAIAREAMPGKKVIVIGAPGWHANVGAPLAGTPISVEWWRMLLEEVHANADGFAIWMKADQPKPTTEPWWLETEAFLARAA